MKNFEYYFNEHAIILFCATVICIALFSLILKHHHRFHIHQHNQTQALDGLRGLLALFVLSWHFYLTFIWKSGGEWANQPTPVITNHGSVPVSLFFLITGFLFINKMRQPNVNWKNLYISRLKRIYPLYLIMLLPVAFFTATHNIEHHQDWGKFATWLKHWLIFRGDEFGAFKSWIVIGGVQWTLLYEWAFYCFLPVIWLIWHKKAVRPILFLCVPLITWYLWKRSDWRFYQLFVLALPAVWLTQSSLSFFQQRHKIWDSLILVLLLAILWFTEPYGYAQMLGLAIVFAFITQGYDFLGILCQRGLCILGTISYSIYLIHGFVLYLLFTVIGIYDFSQPNFYHYMMYLPVVFAISIILSLLSYRFIEQPFLNKKSIQAA